MAGRIDHFPDLVMESLRGSSMMMNAELHPGEPVPTKINPDDPFRERIVAAEKHLHNLKKLNLGSFEKEAEALYQQEIESFRINGEKIWETQMNCLRMMQAATCWRPPQHDHEEIKRGLLLTLIAGVRDCCRAREDLKEPKKMSARRYQAYRMREARGKIATLKVQQKRWVENVAKANRSLKLLKDSLGID